MKFIAAILFATLCLQFSIVAQKTHLNWDAFTVSVAQYIDKKPTGYTILPSSAVKAKEENWQGGVIPIPNAKIFCPKGDTTLCTLYDKKNDKFIGLHLSIPEPVKNLEIDSAPDAKEEDPQKPFTTKAAYDAFKKRSINSKGLLALDVFFPNNLQYLVDVTSSTNQRFTSNKLIVSGKEIKQIPTKEEELAEPFWYKQNCAEKRGTHYGFALMDDGLCDEYYPLFPLVKDEQLVGILFMVPGKHQSTMNWFQEVGGEYIKNYFPKTAQCFKDSAPYSVLHLSFVDPKTITKCESKDNVQSGWFSWLSG